MANSPSARAPASVAEALRLDGRVVVITGAAGLLGRKHAEAVAEMGASPVLVDIDRAGADDALAAVARRYGVEGLAVAADITREEEVAQLAAETLARFGRVDALINNAARNPKVEAGTMNFSRLERFPVAEWDLDIAVGLTGAFLCSRALGAVMADAGRGVILNIASDLGVIAPDQRLYRRDGAAAADQPVKPVTYSVVKAGLIGLTRYLSTYWADRGVRCNSISPGGVYAGQPEAFLDRLENLIPLGRMAHPDEYKSAIAFLISDASSYMNGANLVIDGGRSAW
jgi:NAD(P)-dependent dehydrogenase (short-subunit alcohol dehydrogenase family)